MKSKRLFSFVLAGMLMLPGDVFDLKTRKVAR